MAILADDFLRRFSPYCCRSAIRLRFRCYDVTAVDYFFVFIFFIDDSFA